jgi:hypothetical protein
MYKMATACVVGLAVLASGALAQAQDSAPAASPAAPPATAAPASVTPTQAAAQTPAPNTVTLSPAAGVSLALPKGWIACDDATNKLLGQADDPNGLKSIVCANSPVQFALRVFDPVPFRTISLMIVYSKKQDITPEGIAAITPEIMANIQTDVCKGVTAPMTAGSDIESCKAEIGQFAGHAAFVTTVVGTPHGGTRLAQFEVVIYEFPYSQGYLQVQFNTATLLKSATSPMIDALKASFVVQ